MTTDASNITGRKTYTVACDVPSRRFGTSRKNEAMSVAASWRKQGVPGVQVWAAGDDATDRSRVATARIQ